MKPEHRVLVPVLIRVIWSIAPIRAIVVHIPESTGVLDFEVQMPWHRDRTTRDSPRTRGPDRADGRTLGHEPAIRNKDRLKMSIQSIRIRMMQNDNIPHTMIIAIKIC